MSLVWRKIQRSNKKAAKFRFTATFNELVVECSEKWQPQKLAIAWVHRRRRFVTKERKWEPSIVDPYRGIVVWPQQMPEVIDIVTTLYRDSRSDQFEDKEWTFVVEEITAKGKTKPIAAVSLNLRLFVHEIPGTKSEVKLKLRPLNANVAQCVMQLVLTSNLVKEGDALDDDLQSEASVMSQAPRASIISASTSANDVANLNDLNDEFRSTHSQLADGCFDGAAQQAAVGISEVYNEIEKWKESAVTSKEPILPKSPDGAAIRPLTSKVKSESSSFDRSEKAPPPPPAPAPKEPPKRSSHLDDSALPDSAPPDSVPSNASANFSFNSIIGGKNSQNDSGIGSEAPRSANDVVDRKKPASEMEDLLAWCQRTTAGYKGVRIADFSKSWRSGLAFCAVLHRHRPELIGDFEKLDFSDNPTAIRSNCRKAFDAGSSLGIARLLDENVMTVMKEPDRFAVTTYVHELRAILTGQRTPGPSTSTKIDFDNTNNRLSLIGLSETEAQIMGEFLKLKRQREEADAFDFRNEPLPDDSAPSIKWAAVAKLKTRNGDEDDTDAMPSMTTPLMKRRELLRPFDSDSDEDGERQNAAAPASPSHKPNAFNSLPRQQSPSKQSSPPGHEQSPTRSISQQRSSSSSTEWGPAAFRKTSDASSGGVRREELRRRAREMLTQTSHDRDGNEQTQDADDDERIRRLREEARRLIDEASSEGTVIRISDTVSAPNSTAQTPSHQPRRLSRTSSMKSSGGSNGDLRKLDVISPPVEFYQFRKREPSPATQRRIYAQPALPALGRSQDRIVLDMRRTSDNQYNAPESTFDRVKRYGSMRRQELTESISVLSSRLSHTVRSTSLPKEIAELTNQLTSPNGPSKQFPSSNSATSKSMLEDDSSIRKVSTEWEKDLSSRKKLVADQQEVARKLKELCERGANLEKRMRQAEPGSAEEQDLLNEHLRLLNEKDALIRKEQHLNIVESMRDIDERSNLVQQELHTLIEVEESDKTEMHKQKIDRLMEELVTLVNKKDELVHQLIDNEAESEAAEEHNRRTLERTGNNQYFNRNSQESASKRFISWLKS
uniref:EH domain-binding protein 1 n=1 Tax=Plectus sambesii TaxID=2011161 RepID=A0A914WK25_9BILA